MTIIDNIKERVKLEDLVAESGVKLKKHGTSMTGFCPFHENKHTPSLVVWRNGTWRCFGCNRGGDVFHWVLEKNPGWDFKEAMKHLAERAGIELRTNHNAPGLAEREVEHLREKTMKVAMGVFRRWLVGKTERDGQVTVKGDEEALAYALDRGWTEKTLKAEGVGFSGRATATHKKEMLDEFGMYGIDSRTPTAVMILGYRGDLKVWAKEQGLDSNDFDGNYLTGFMDTPGLMFAHKEDGKHVYLSQRFLPNYEEKKGRKSHNPSSAVAGERKPYFNSLFKKHYSEGKEKGKRIHIVEGQGDAITWAQFGEPAMALCGSSWQALEESGILKTLNDEYEAICYSMDTDASGEAVVIGQGNEAGKFPLTVAFGPMLWVERPPKYIWTRPNGKEKTVKDVNDLAQYLADSNAEQDTRRKEVLGMIHTALPIVVLAAEYAGSQGGQEKEYLINHLVRPLVLAMPPETRNNYASQLAKAVYPGLAKTAQEALFKSWQNSVRATEKNKKEDETKLPEIETRGGWYPDMDNKDAGHLVEMYYDRDAEKLRLAWVYLKSIKRNEREFGTGKVLELGRKILVPPEYDQIIQEGIERHATAIKFPTKVGEKFTTAQIIKRCADFYQKYFFSEDKSKFSFCAVWALNTHVYDCFSSISILRAMGPAGCGKSDLMYLVGLTSYRFAVTAAVSSPTSHIGLAKLYNATDMIDEYDSAMKRDDGTLEGYLKARPMRRIAHSFKMMEVMSPSGKTFIPSNTPIYGATMVTGYEPFADKGIESRCTTFHLTKEDMMILDKNDYEPGFYPPELEEEGEAIRNICLRWRLENWLPTIELTEEERKAHKLNDVQVDARENQLLRSAKVMAVKQNDMELLDELFKIGRANFEDRLLELSGSFEAMVLRAMLAADIAKDLEMGLEPQASADYASEVKAYAEFVKIGKVGKHGTVRYILYKNVARILNEIFDLENVAENESDDVKARRKKAQSKTVGDICRDAFRMPVERTWKGWVVILARQRLEIAKRRLGLDRENEYDPNFKEEAADSEDAKSVELAVPVQTELPVDDSDGNWREDENGVMWKKD